MATREYAAQLPPPIWMGAVTPDDRLPYSVDVSRMQQIAKNLEEVTAAVVGSPEITAPDLRVFLGFINKVVQVADQVFEDVYTILIDISLLRESELDTDRILQMQRSVALLVATSRYRDAEEICSRLHHLSEHFHDTVGSVVERAVGDTRAWYTVFELIDEHEGYLIRAVQHVSHRFSGLLDHLTVARLPEVRAVAATQAREVHATIERMTSLRNQILGLSGTTGLIKLVAVDDRKAAVKSLTIREVHVGDKYDVTGAGAVGPGAQAHDIVISQRWQAFATTQNLDELAHELARLRAELRARASEPAHDFAVAEVAAAEVAAQDDDGTKVRAHLAKAGKWALQVATSIGTTVAAKAIGASMGL